MRGDAFRVFISYSHRDEAFRQALEEHLALLKREGSIDVWQDRKIVTGQNWSQEIDAQLESADLILLLVSPSFIASDYCYAIEMRRALERHGTGSARVAPIVIRPCDWTGAPFAKLQALPKNGRPVTKWGNRDEAWLEVADGLRRLVAEIRSASAKTSAVAGAAIFSVPFSRNPFFTGREKELAKLAKQLAAGGSAAIGQAITGLGGIGKTQTAVEFAYRHRAEYRAVFFVRAETETDLVGGFAAIAGLLFLPEAAEKDQQAAAQAARRWLDLNDGWLLILDNADIPKLLQPFLPAGGRGHFLITSRTRNFATLHVAEQRLAPPPSAEALVFLLERTGRKKASRHERRAAADLAADLGKLPLALEQAAAYLVQRQASFADYLASYRRRGIELLQETTPEAGTAHATVAVTWSLNFEEIERIAPASADLLRAVAFLAPEAIPDEFLEEGGGALSPAIASAVAVKDPLAVAELAAPLMQYSLLERDGEARTLSVHRMVQEVVKQNLGDFRAETLDRVVDALRQAFPWPRFGTWPRCDRLLAHVFAIAKAAEESDQLASLLTASGIYLTERARFAEAEPLFLRSLAVRESMLGEHHPKIARALNNLANLYVRQNRLSAAEPLFLRALAILMEEFGENDAGAAPTLYALAHLYRRQNRLSEAEPLYLRAR